MNSRDASTASGFLKLRTDKTRPSQNFTEIDERDQSDSGTSLKYVSIPGLFLELVVLKKHHSTQTSQATLRSPSILCKPIRIFLVSPRFLIDRGRDSQAKFHRLRAGRHSRKVHPLERLHPATVAWSKKDAEPTRLTTLELRTV